MVSPWDTQAGSIQQNRMCPRDNPNATFAPLLVDNASYNYYSWAIKVENIILPGVDPNDTNYDMPSLLQADFLIQLGDYR